MRWGLALLAVVAAAAVLAIWWTPSMPFKPPEKPAIPPESAMPAPCREMAFDNVGYIVCTADTGTYDVVLRRADSAGKAYGSLAALAATEPFVFAMNAGMYHEDLSPVGLHVEEGVEHAPLNLADAPGNFFMKPNGVFFIAKDGRAGVLESNAYASGGTTPLFATQSGPMLVIDGAIHPRFESDGTSRHVRNGVGVDGEGRAVFAVSQAPVSLGRFARLFRDGLDCRNALFFDGAVSALHNGEKYLVGGGYPAGPIVALKRKGNAAQ